ncbi:DUF58 domain-containing protein [Natronorubrum halophilum]|uniref:DUF58 domain-containing protein n=1 Tax=Natronorubrum halophilum TaxID=1702106 RepID=UPI000EF6BAB6|nr:DUF58 domain-containing protein [Natronorubrum halophilum]
MRPTRHTVAIGVLIVFVATLSIVLARPLLLAGPILIGAWVLSRQYRFYSALSRVNDSIVVDQSIERPAVKTEEAVPVTLAVSLDQPSGLALDVAGGPPIGANTDDPLTVSIGPNETGASKTVSAKWPVAGMHDFTQPTIVATDGLFAETIGAGPTPEVTVGAQTSRYPDTELVVDRITTAMGKHVTSRFGSGIEPIDIREYTAGDMLNRIDWNVTARLGKLYVRDFESQTTRGTMLVVDHRTSLGDGAPAESKLDYLREVALATTDHVHEHGDPIGLLTVGNDGITGRLKTASSSRTYDTVRRRLLALEPMEAPDRPLRRSDGLGERLTDTDLRRRIERLKTLDRSGDFGDVIVPYYERQLTYEHRFEDDPFHSAVESAVVRQRAPVWMILFTDDHDRAELYRTVKTARHSLNRVLVVLAPGVLFDIQEMTDTQTVAQRYAAFEEYRRSLERIEGVNVVEVGSKDRFATLLSAMRQENRPSGVA